MGKVRTAIDNIDFWGLAENEGEWQRRRVVPNQRYMITRKRFWAREELVVNLGLGVG